MPYIKKPAFEGFRARLIAQGRPLPEHELVPIQARVVAQLDLIEELLVQKTRRVGHKDGLLEITAAWVGLNATQREAISVIKAAWPGELFGELEESFWIGENEEAVLLTFAVSYPADRYLTGRLLVTF